MTTRALPVRLVDVAEGNGDLVVSAAGVSATERLVCFVDTDTGGGGGAVAGWSLLADDGAGADLGFVYARDELGAGAGDHTFVIRAGADGAAMLVAVDGSPTVDDAAAATGTGTTMTAPSVTPGDQAERQLLVWWKTWSHVNQTDATITTPGGMTVIADDVASGAGWGRRSVATEAVGAGATGTRTATSDPGNRWVALSVALSAEGGATSDADIDLDAAVTGTTVKAGETTSEFDLDASISGAADATKVASSDAIDLDLSVGAASAAQKKASTEFDLVLSVDEADGTSQKEASTDYDLILGLGGDTTTGEKSVSASLNLDLAIDPDSATKSVASATDIDLDLDLDTPAVKSGINTTDLGLLLDFDGDVDKTGSGSAQVDVELDIDNSSS